MTFSYTHPCLTFCEYQQQAARAARRDAPDRLTGSLQGLGSQCGELLATFQHAAERGKPVDLGHVAEDLGDCLWRLADITDALGLSLEGIAAQNLTKLRRRHPPGFAAATRAARMGERDAPTSED